MRKLYLKKKKKSNNYKTHHQKPTTLAATQLNSTLLVTRTLSLPITIVKVNNATARVQTKKVTAVPNGKLL